MIINILHLPNDPNYPHREVREKSAIKQMEEQGASYMFWDGIMTKERKVGISQAHKAIVKYHKDIDAKYCCIAEDDINFTHKDSFKYFLSQMPEEFDLYLSGYYSGSVNENNEITKFSGLTMYIIKSQYYDTFLSASEKFHLDTALGMMGGKFVVCDKFVCTQAPGFSDQRNRYCDDSKRIQNKPMFHG